MSIIFIVLALGLVPGIWMTKTHNSLITKRNQVDYAFSSVDVMLSKRHNLIPNLVAVLKMHMHHETGLMDKLIQLKAQTSQKSLPAREKIELENQLSHRLGEWRLAVSKSPAFRSSENFLQLQAALNEAEEQLSAARRAYNGAVFAYNTSVETVPNNILAQAFGHEPLAMFELSDTSRSYDRQLEG